MKKTLPVFALLFFATLPLTEISAASNDSASPAAMMAMPGIKVGEKAPDFTLQNTAGEKVVLQDLLQNEKVVLVFVRSADWCPFCRTQLQALEKSRAEIEMTGAQLIAVSYDSPEKNA